MKQNIQKYLIEQKLDELYEKRDDCDEAIIIKNEIVTEDTTIANIAIFYENSGLLQKIVYQGTRKTALLEEKNCLKRYNFGYVKKCFKSCFNRMQMIGFDEIKDFKIKEAEI